MARTVIYIKELYYRILKEFLKESSIHGLKIFLTTTSIQCAKHIWFIFLTGIIIITHVIIINLIIQFVDQPTEVIIPPKQTHVAYCPFPAVAICGANKISRKKMMRYAEKVYAAQQAIQPELIAKNPIEMAEQLRVLTEFYPKLYNTPYFDTDSRIENLHDILVSMYNTSKYSLRNILKDLAPDCEDIVMRGMAFGKAIDIRKYIEKRTTSVGACCLFNYDRHTYQSKRQNLEDVDFESNSMLNSVQFVLKSEYDDIWHTESDSLAYELHFFPSEDYPAIVTSTMGQIKININGVMEVQVQPTIYDASLAIRNYSPESRGCYFEDEGQRMFNISHYSLDECLLICRMQLMLHYCDCVSPLLLPNLINASECSLMQLPCLTQWEAQFNRQTYFDYIEHSSSIFASCEECLPTCTGVDYEIYNNFYYLRSAIKPKELYAQGILNGLSRDDPLALLAFYFKKQRADMTETDIVGDWVMLMSRFGGILSLFYGFSIISYIEIVYYFSAKWFVLLKKTWRLIELLKMQEQREVEIPEYPPLYWDELQPKSAKVKKYQEDIYKKEKMYF